MTVWCKHLDDYDLAIAKEALDKHVFPGHRNIMVEEPCVKCLNRLQLSYHCLYCKARVCKDHLLEHSAQPDHKDTNFSILFSTGDLYCLGCKKEVFPASYNFYRIEKYIQFYTLPDDYIQTQPSVRFSIEKLQRHNNYRNLGMVGLPNLGNTCYMNCCLQFFLHNRTVIQWLIFHKCSYSGDHPRCLTCELRTLLHKFYNPTRIKIPCPSNIFTIMLDRRKEFLESAGYQQDVQEALSWIIEDIANQDDKHSQNFSKLFYGTLQTPLKCQNCGNQTIHYETCSNFVLPFLEDTLSISDCLSKFLEDLFYPVTCKICEGRYKKCSESQFLTLPQIFVLAISQLNTQRRLVTKGDRRMALEKELDVSYFFAPQKRENSDEQIATKSVRIDDLSHSEASTSSPPTPEFSTVSSDSGLDEENSENIFPASSTLSSPLSYFANRCSRKRKHPSTVLPTKYQLEGVVYHRGDAKGGHYYIKLKNHLLRNPDDNNWIECDDLRVSETSIDVPCDDQPYLFFYCLNNNNNITDSV